MQENIKFIAEWTKPKDELIHTEAFSRIINFYLFSTPCNGTSSSGLSLKKRGWGDKPWQSGELRAFLLHQAGLSVGVNYLKATTTKEVLQKASEIGLTKSFYKIVTDNRIAFYGSGKRAEFMEVFFYIRCAFAHGRFKLKTLESGDVIYYLEALERKNSDCFILKARMAIKEETLLEWIDTIVNGNDNLIRRKDEFHLYIQRKIINLFKDNEAGLAKRSILDCLDEDNKVVSKQIEELKKRKILKYDRHSKKWIKDNSPEEVD